MSIFLLLLSFTLANAATPAEIAASYQLTTSTAFPFPTATAPTTDTQNLIVSEWSLSKGKIQDLPSDLAFVDDPFPSSNTSASPVLQVTYPAGSFSHSTGGTQFENLWNTSGSGFQSMLISYEVAFDQNFDFVKGGKLPGLRGGANTTGCSGGSEPDGTDCFSARIMWRQNGAGEVYAYIPTPNGLCNINDVICNDDFGVSLSRGAFSFTTGTWNQIALLIQLNSKSNLANGNVQLFFNNQSVINQADLQFRSTTSLDANGMFFSTFFGGSDDSWATPSTVRTYFRNIQLWGSSQPSNQTGLPVSHASARFSHAGHWVISVSLAVAILSIIA